MLIPNGWAHFESRAYTFPLCTSGPLLPLFVVVENLIYTKDSLSCNCLTQFFFIYKTDSVGKSNSSIFNSKVTIEMPTIGDWGFQEDVE